MPWHDAKCAASDKPWRWNILYETFLIAIASRVMNVSWQNVPMYSDVSTVNLHYTLWIHCTYCTYIHVHWTVIVHSSHPLSVNFRSLLFMSERSHFSYKITTFLTAYNTSQLGSRAQLLPPRPCHPSRPPGPTVCDANEPGYDLHFNAPESESATVINRELEVRINERHLQYT